MWPAARNITSSRPIIQRNAYFRLDIIPIDPLRKTIIFRLQKPNPFTALILSEKILNLHPRIMMFRWAIAPMSVDWNRIADQQKIALSGTISFGRPQELPVHLKMDTAKECAAPISPTMVFAQS